MKSNKINILVCFVGLVFLSFSASGAIPRISKQSNNQNLNTFLPEGSFRGGISGNGYSLLKIKRVYALNGKSERFILEIGNREGKPHIGKPGYFHAQLFRNPSELSLDLSQLTMSRITQSDLNRIFTKSKLVAKSVLVLDAEDRSTHLSMQFKYPVKMRVFTLSPKNKTSKLVIDVIRL